MEKTRTKYSYYHKDLSISIAVPVDWDVIQNEDFALAVIEQERNAFKANVGFNIYALEGDDPSKFQSAIDSALENLRTSYKDYVKISQEQVWIDGYPAFYHEYEWDSESIEGILRQSLTLIFVFPNLLYEVIGSLEQGKVEEKGSTLKNIISSFRYIETK